MEEEKHSLAAKDKAVSLPALPPGLKLDSGVSECKKQNCLCAPTTHAGSFRCRLHRLPPPSPASQIMAAKKASSAQKLSSPKVKLALHHKLKQGFSKRASSSSSCPHLQQDMPGLSRLSRTSLTKEQKQSFRSDQEALTVLWKTSSTVLKGDESLEPAKQIISSEASGGELSSLNCKSSYVRPLVKLPSI